MADLIRGFKYALQGFSLLLKPGIRLFVIIPLMINTLLFAGAIYFGASSLNDLIDSFLTGWWEWLRWVLWPVFIVISLTIIFFCFSIFANLIASPFNGFLAEAAENYLTGRQIKSSSGLSQLPGEIKRALLSEARKFLYFAIRAIPLVLFFFIPFINFAAPFIWFLFGTWMLALEYLDFPLGNHGILFPELRSRMKSNRALAFGFGLGVMFLTLIPILNFVAIPVAVCGATKLWVERISPT